MTSQTAAYQSVSDVTDSLVQSVSDVTDSLVQSEIAQNYGVLVYDQWSQSSAYLTVVARARSNQRI